MTCKALKSAAHINTINLLGSESENLSRFVTREYARVNSLSNT